MSIVEASSASSENLYVNVVMQCFLAEEYQDIC